MGHRDHCSGRWHESTGVCSLVIVVVGSAIIWALLQCARIAQERGKGHEMSITIAFAIAFAIITLAGLGLAGFALWLRNRDEQPEKPESKRLEEA